MFIKKIVIFVVICFLLVPNSAYAFFEKKDSKKTLLENALKSEKRKDDKSVFFIYEKGLFYYKDDKAVLEAYAKFCERKKYYDKAINLNKKLYDLTKDEHFLFKSYLLEIFNGKASTARYKEITSDKKLSSKYKKTLNEKLVKQFSYEKDWENTKIFCDKIPMGKMGKETSRVCAIANEKLSNEKTAYKYYLRLYENDPKDTVVVKKILARAEKNHDYAMQEKFLKKLAKLNPKDNGIKYRLAGFYEKNKKYDKALEVYAKLIASGDKSKHVLKSYNFLIKKPPKGETYQKIQLTPYQKEEMELYAALDAKDFSKAKSILENLLKQKPKDLALLKLQLDISMALDDFKKALAYFENLYGTSNLSVENQKMLAFLYSKNDNAQKSLEIIENLLKESPKNKELTGLALDYSMVQKDWDKAIFYNEKLLAFSPKDEKLFKNRGDFYSIKKDFKNAAKAYEVLTKNYPKTEYKFELSNLYMANKDFDKAQSLLEKLHKQYPDNIKITEAYLEVLATNKKFAKALCLIQKYHLEFTKKGAMIMGDAAMENKDYRAAKRHYLRAVYADKKDIALKNKLAQSYRMLKRPQDAARLYDNVLSQDPSNKDAKLGLGYLAIDQKNYPQARYTFNEILRETPEYKPARVGMANSYIANGDNLQSLDTLKKIPADEEIKLMEAQTYYKMGMPSDAKNSLSGLISKDAEDLRYKIKREQAFRFTPSYTYFNQKLASEFDLDYNKWGINLSQGIKNNLNIFTDFNQYIYSSGSSIPPVYLSTLNNVTNEVRMGVMGRPEEKNEFRADIGAKIFQFNTGHMINTDSWIKHHFNDKFNLKFGFWRNNLEQSYLSAVGLNMDNVLTGQVADNRSYVEYQYRFPRQYYSFGRCSYGIMKGKNIPTNPYMEGMVGFGRLLYNEPDKKGVNTVNLDFVSYNSGYRYNLLNLYDSVGNLYGGYFSPAYFSANTLNLKVEGKRKKLRYGLETFGGAQFSIHPDKNTTTWGFSPRVSYDFNDRVSANLFYNLFNYADMQRNILMFNLVIRGF